MLGQSGILAPELNMQPWIIELYPEVVLALDFQIMILHGEEGDLGVRPSSLLCTVQEGQKIVWEHEGLVKIGKTTTAVADEVKEYSRPRR